MFMHNVRYLLRRLDIPYLGKARLAISRGVTQARPSFRAKSTTLRCVACFFSAIARTSHAFQSGYLVRVIDFIVQLPSWKITPASRQWDESSFKVRQDASNASNCCHSS